MKNLFCIYCSTTGDVDAKQHIFDNFGTPNNFLATAYIVKLLKNHFNVTLIDISDTPSILPILLLDGMVGIHYKNFDFKLLNNSIVWYMLRDPLPIKAFDRINGIIGNFSSILTVNDYTYMKDFSKSVYYPIGYKYNVCPQILENNKNIHWQKPSHTCTMSDDNKFIKTSNVNNVSKKPSVITQYIDNYDTGKGYRTVERYGYIQGHITDGVRYFFKENVYIGKSGLSYSNEKCKFPDKHREKLSEFFKEVKLDFFHFECIEINNDIYVIDINPFPTSGGRTLNYISENIVTIFKEVNL